MPPPMMFQAKVRGNSAKAKVPLLGRAIEKYILSQTSDGASDELSYLRDYLEGP